MNKELLKLDLGKIMMRTLVLYLPTFFALKTFNFRISLDTSFLFSSLNS